MKLVSGTTAAQALGILVTPVLTRLYTPEAFGHLALFTSITGILGSIACLRYQLAIMLPECHEEAANLLAVSLGFAVLVSMLTVPVIFGGRESIGHWLNAPQIASYLWLVPPAVFVAGVFLALNYWNTRTKHFGRLSVARVTSSVAIASTTLGAGYAGYATGGTLIGANIAGQALATVVLGGQIWHNDRKLFLGSIRWQGILSGLKRHRKFPLYGTWTVLLNTASWQLPAFLLSAFFSSTVVGYYALGFRILQLPMSMIGAAIAQVFFQRAAEAHMQGTLAVLVQNTFQRLVMIGLLPMLVLAMIGRDVYVVVFGPTWAEAGVYTQILSLWAFFWFISSPLSTLFGVLEKQEFGLKLNIFLFVTRFASLAVGAYFADARLAIILFSASGVVIYGYLNLAVMASSGISYSQMLSALATGFFCAAPFVLVILFFSVLDISILIKLLISFVTSITYFSYLWKSKSSIFHMP